MTDNDQAMRNIVATLPVPEFAEAAFTAPPPLRNARVAIVTSAASTGRGPLRSGSRTPTSSPSRTARAT